jgi:peptidoglycan LD-endopeptidase CwlK
MSTRLEDLTSATQSAAVRALADLKARAVSVVVTYTLRTKEEQAALYAQGRKSLAEVNALRATAGLRPIGNAENSYTVTKCNGIRIVSGGTGISQHQLGTALDVVPLGPRGPVWPSASDPRWEQIAQSFKAQGFEWGGDWTSFQDLPHYQIGGVA